MGIFLEIWIYIKSFFISYRNDKEQKVKTGSKSNPGAKFKVSQKNFELEASWCYHGHEKQKAVSFF